MNYSQIRKMDISNGIGIGTSLFVSGCPIHCSDCFNQNTWDFGAGKPFTGEIEKYFLDLADKPYIDRISILGGEPMADQNFDAVYDLVNAIRYRFGKSKKIWIYSGYTFEYLYDHRQVTIFPLIDVLVDGAFEQDKKDLTLPFRGSSNQRIIDIPATLEKGEVVELNVNL